MPSKRRRAQWKSANAASVQSFKKRKSEASSLLNSTQLKVNDTKLSTTDTSDTESNSEVWFWNESANETDSDSEEEGDGDEDESDIEIEVPRTEQTVSPVVCKKEVKWNKEGEDKLRGSYGKGSRSTQMRKQRSARKLEKEASKTYNIQALWQRSRDLGMISAVKSQDGLDQAPESLLNNGAISAAHSLSEIPLGGSPSLSKQEIHKQQQIEALEDLTRLLKLVTEQEKKYEDRLSPHSNFYRRHLMVQQFLQTQLKTQPSQRRRVLALNVARAFGRSNPTARNIVRWERSWLSIRKIPERKERDDGKSWMYDEEVNDAIRAFARTQGDSKYYFG